MSEGFRIAAEHIAEPHTGIYVRARDLADRWGSFDIAQLDAESLVAFLRSRGEVSVWALGVVFVLLGRSTEGLT